MVRAERAFEARPVCPWAPGRRWCCGIEDLAADYGRERKDIEEAICCELRLAEAA